MIRKATIAYRIIEVLSWEYFKIPLLLKFWQMYISCAWYKLACDELKYFTCQFEYLSNACWAISQNLILFYSAHVGLPCTYHDLPCTCMLTYHTHHNLLYILLFTLHIMICTVHMLIHYALTFWKYSLEADTLFSHI